MTTEKQHQGKDNAVFSMYLVVSISQDVRPHANCHGCPIQGATYSRKQPFYVGPVRALIKSKTKQTKKTKTSLCLKP